ncbi:LacI family DNA-binding transcriptional regulator [Actinomyces israelii]|uniref:LacI family DNA-binding transcriptional regulator n=1 Tax=Actinomyces israelii TaxID=1659 RepID=UPI0023552E08|nr:LacI family DNA-binding transcriptional regulator [Actinomyces israelii]
MPGASPGGRPTMNDIAHELGLSQAAVSLVFRGRPGVSEETRRRVLRTAERLGYVRDESARALRAQNPTSIGIAFRTHQPFHDALLDGFYAAAAHTPYNLVLSAISESRDERTVVEDLLAHRCGALILIGPRTHDDELAAFVRGTPLVVVARRCEVPGSEWVVSDDEGGMQAIVGHLADLGHRRITYLASPLDAGGPDRVQAFLRAAESVGMRTSVGVEEGGITEADGIAAAERLISSGCMPTAVVAFNDRCALGVLELLSSRGVAVPDDISVVGFDDSSIAARPTTSITTVHQDASALAGQSIERASRRLSGEPRSGGKRGTVVPTYLVRRSTTGPVR